MSSVAEIPRQPVALEIGGQRLRLAANTDPEHLAQLATLVNERFESLKAATRSNNAATLLALVCLDLADELASTKRDLGLVRRDGVAAVASAEARAREVEAMARTTVVEALREIDRMLDESAGQNEAERGETA